MQRLVNGKIVQMTKKEEEAFDNSRKQQQEPKAIILLRKKEKMTEEIRKKCIDNLIKEELKAIDKATSEEELNNIVINFEV